MQPWEMQGTQFLSPIYLGPSQAALTACPETLALTSGCYWQGPLSLPAAWLDWLSLPVATGSVRWPCLPLVNITAHYDWLVLSGLIVGGANNCFSGGEGGGGGGGGGGEGWSPKTDWKYSDCNGVSITEYLGERSEPPVVSNAHRRSVMLSVPWAFPGWVGSNMRYCTQEKCNVVGAMGISGMGGVEHETLHTGEV